MGETCSRADLNVRSRHSDRSPEWLLRRLDFPDSTTDPLELYRKLRERGMQFVTLTDPDRIDGCLEIAGQPGTFLSETVTTCFPEDRCPIQVLVWGIDEGLHREISEARESIYDLQALLASREIAHAVAHPLYSLNRKLLPSHVERLILLFRHFETLDAGRDWMLGDAAAFILSRLTPERVGRMAERHGIAPTHPEPWRKVFVGGSGDRGGIAPGIAHTRTAPCSTPAEFLARIRAGECEPCGAGGEPLLFAHGLYATLYRFVKQKYAAEVHGRHELLSSIFSRFIEGRDPTSFTLSEKVGFVAEGLISGRIFELAKPGHASLWAELADYFNRSDLKAILERETAEVREPERRSFLIATHVANELAFRFFNKFLRQLSGGNLLESIQALSGLVPIGLLLAPYIHAFHSQSASQSWLRSMCRELAGEIPRHLQNRKRAWLTDTLEDVNGVATTIRKMAAAAAAAGEELVVITSREQIRIHDIPIRNFPPVGEFAIPEYELQKLSFPPVLKILDHLRRERFTEIIISTPGPVGLCGLLAAKTFGLRTSGIYHTDFPQYVSILTNDSWMETVTWHYMHWFYSQLDLLLVNSEHYRRCWIERGIAPEKIRILPRGLDTDLFHPRQRDRSFWAAHGIEPDAPLLLYVGRVSKEKNLDVLAAAYRALKPRHPALRLAVVGEGPYLAEMRRDHPDAIFTGSLTGKALASAYASADIFVFPSTTDTFGNVILEAQASGLPTVVSDIGGPKELVGDGALGIVTQALDVASFTAAIESLLADPTRRAAMGRAARAAVENRSWDDAFRAFWAMSDL